MYNPQEAKEDNHALGLAILFFATIVVGLLLYLHHDSGIKYWLLGKFGETVPGKLISVVPASENLENADELARQDPRNYLKNIDNWVGGATLRIEYFVDAEPHVIDVRVNAQGRPIRSFDIAYFPPRPRIAYPAEYLKWFSFDGKLTLYLVIALLPLAFFWYRLIAKWRDFREKARRY